MESFLYKKKISVHTVDNYRREAPHSSVRESNCRGVSPLETVFRPPHLQGDLQQEKIVDFQSISYWLTLVKWF